MVCVCDRLGGGSGSREISRLLSSLRGWRLDWRSSCAKSKWSDLDGSGTESTW